MNAHEQEQLIGVRETRTLASVTNTTSPERQTFLVFHTVVFVVLFWCPLNFKQGRSGSVYSYLLLPYAVVSSVVLNKIYIIGVGVQEYLVLGKIIGVESYQPSQHSWQAGVDTIRTVLGRILFADWENFGKRKQLLPLVPTSVPIKNPEALNCKEYVGVPCTRS